MKGALLDANLLCLIVVGRIDRSAIAHHPRLKAYDADDFDTLGAILDRVGDPVFCPHILAEVSNLLVYRQTASQSAAWRKSLAELILQFREESEDAAKAIKDSAYSRLGLADAILLILASCSGLSLVSDDLHLCLEAERRDLRTINYSYVRDGALRVSQL